MLKCSTFGLAMALTLALLPASSHSFKGTPQATLKAELGQPVVEAGKSQTAVLRIGLTGAAQTEHKRSPVNLCFVLDTSGSMVGDRLEKAKEAARYAIGLLQKDDIVSLITFSDSAQVLTPAAPLGDSKAVLAAIETVKAAGSTALFAGVSVGASELRRFKDQGRINRMILLSDGQANTGPSTPGELGSLGASLIKEGISVTTLGLGTEYNEDLMTQLALKSDGNHAFVQNAQDLSKFFGFEFGDVLSVVAQEATIKVDFLNGVHPVRFLGRELEFDNTSAFSLLNQLYAGHEKYVMLEVVLPAGVDGSQLEVARIHSTYHNMLSGQPETLETTVSVRYSASGAAVTEATSKSIMSDVVKQRATAINAEAVKLRDQGKVQEACRKLLDNAAYLNKAAEQYGDKKLKDLENMQRLDASNLDPARWNTQRKSMLKNQQMYIQDARY